MASKVLESNNYGMFELWEFNRDVTKTKKLTQSMKTHGWINSKPMSVVQMPNGKLRIKDGHHRFDIAQRLGMPVKYVIDTDNSTPNELYETYNPWSLLDSLTSYCRAGKEEYLKVRDYCEETRISLALAASMLIGESAGSGNYRESFRQGTFKVNPRSNHAEIVKAMILCMKKNGVKFYNNNLLVQALSKCVWLDDFSSDHLNSKIKNFAFMVEKKANLEQYLEMLEEVYNRQSRIKIPLKYLALEKAKERGLMNQYGFTKQKTMKGKAK